MAGLKERCGLGCAAGTAASSEGSTAFAGLSRVGRRLCGSLFRAAWPGADSVPVAARGGRPSHVPERAADPNGGRERSAGRGHWRRGRGDRPGLRPDADLHLGGTDASFFGIAGGFLRVGSAPDHESPADSGTDNVYDVTVRVSDGTATETQAVQVTVTDVNEPGTVTPSVSFRSAWSSRRAVSSRCAPRPAHRNGAAG